MLDLRGSSANTENLRIRPGPENRLKETVHLCNYITDHLELLLEHILNTHPDEMWQEKYDQSVELFSRMCKALENFVSLKHPQSCVKCKYN